MLLANALFRDRFERCIVGILRPARQDLQTPVIDRIAVLPYKKNVACFRHRHDQNPIRSLLNR